VCVRVVHHVRELLRSRMAALQRFDDGIKQGWQMVFQILVRKAEALSSKPRIRADPLAPANQQALPAGFELIPISTSGLSLLRQSRGLPPG
jgi:hypothetical protein